MSVDGSGDVPPAPVAPVLQPKPMNRAELAQLKSTFISEIIPYDGKCSAELWIRRFEATLIEYEYNEKFAISNIHHFMQESEVKPWYEGVNNQIQARLYGLNPDYAQLWKEFKDELLNFYNDDYMKMSAHRELKLIKFQSCVSPKDYIAKKKAILTRINPRISEVDITRKVYDGLPVEIQKDLVAVNAHNTNDLLQALERYVSVVPMGSQDKNKSSVKTVYQSPQNTFSDSAPDFSQGRYKSVNIICSYCNRRNHDESVCYTKARDMRTNQGQQWRNGQNQFQGRQAYQGNGNNWQQKFGTQDNIQNHSGNNNAGPPPGFPPINNNYVPHNSQVYYNTGAPGFQPKNNAPNQNNSQVRAAHVVSEQFESGNA